MKEKDKNWFKICRKKTELSIPDFLVHVLQTRNYLYAIRNEQKEDRKSGRDCTKSFRSRDSRHSWHLSWGIVLRKWRLHEVCTLYGETFVLPEMLKASPKLLPLNSSSQKNIPLGKDLQIPTIGEPPRKNLHSHVTILLLKPLLNEPSATNWVPNVFSCLILK